MSCGLKKIIHWYDAESALRPVDRDISLYLIRKHFIRCGLIPIAIPRSCESFEKCSNYLFYC